MVGINVPIPVPMAYYSFGGWKASLFGDSHAHGMEGVHFFTRTKAVTTPLARSQPRRHQPRLPRKHLTPPHPRERACLHPDTPLAGEEFTHARDRGRIHVRTPARGHRVDQRRRRVADAQSCDEPVRRSRIGWRR